MELSVLVYLKQRATSYWIEVTGWEDEVIGYRCGNGEGCFPTEDFRTNNVEDFINDKIKFN